MNSKRKYLYYIIFALILDSIILLTGKSLFPDFMQGGNFSLLQSNIIWCGIFDISLLFFVIKSKAVFDMPYEAIANYPLVWSLSKNDFKVRYVGSYLGIFWAFINPMVTIILYWVVFQFAFHSSDVQGFPFVLWLISGLVPWFLIQDAITNGTGALMEYAYLVKKVLFKVSILPSIKLLSSCFIHVVFVGVVLVVFIVMGYCPKPLYFVQLFYYFICAAAYCLAIIYLTSSIVLFFRDLGQFINVFMQVFMWATPILWNIDIVPVKWQWIFKLNPAYYIVNGYRDSLLFQTGVFEHTAFTLYFWCVVILLFIVGSSVFNKLKPHFADVL